MCLEHVQGRFLSLTMTLSMIVTLAPLSGVLGVDNSTGLTETATTKGCGVIGGGGGRDGHDHATLGGRGGEAECRSLLL